MTKAQAAEPADHGSLGPANLIRPHHHVETIQAGVTAKRYEDSTLVDRLYRAGRLARASDEQGAAERRLAAAEWYATVHRRAYPPKSVTASYGQVRGVSNEGDCDLPDELTALDLTDPRNRNVMDVAMWNRGQLRDAEKAIGRVVMGRIRKLVVDNEMPAVLLCVLGDLDSLAEHRGIS